MNLSELHPDELLWRESCGTLSPNERADLTAHLQRCPACALERVVRIVLRVWAVRVVQKIRVVPRIRVLRRRWARAVPGPEGR